MIELIISAILFVLFGYLGFRKLIHMDQLRSRNLLISASILLFVFILMRALFLGGILSQDTGGIIMCAVYGSISGSFLGAALKLYRDKRKNGEVIYVHQNFATHILPLVIALGLFLFGIQRTSVLADAPVTPIRLTSGLSLISMGLWGFVLRLVPEFRKKGLILLDRAVSWDDFVAYSWYSENTLALEYRLNDHLKEFKTLIPADEQVEVEELLKEKLREKFENEQDQGIDDAEIIDES